VECSQNKPTDIIGSIRKVVPDTSNATVVRHHTATIAIDQTAGAERYAREARGRDEIGKHAGFRCRCSKELEGSSPSARTDAVVVFTLGCGGAESAAPAVAASLPEAGWLAERIGLCGCCRRSLARMVSPAASGDCSVLASPWRLGRGKSTVPMI
jgi:hypothetical protein